MDLKEAYKGKRVLVTGHTGFKGCWLSIWLKSLEAEVIGYSLEPHTEPSMYKVCNLEDEMASIIGDIRNYSKLCEVIEEYKPDMIFHLAAQALVRNSYKNPIETYETNIMGTVNILEASKLSENVKALVVVTTDKCYENKEWIYGYRETDPMGGYDPYSSSKGCAELIVSSYRNSFYNEAGIALASARAGNVIGGGDWSEDRLIPDFIRATIDNKSVELRNPSSIRPWQHVLDPINGYLMLGASLLSDNKKYSSGWNFGPNDSETLNVEEVLSQSINILGKGSISIKRDYDLHEANLLKLDISKAREYLNWKPLLNTQEAIIKTMNWYRSYYDEGCRDMKQYTLTQIKEYENIVRNEIDGKYKK